MSTYRKPLTIKTIEAIKPPITKGQQDEYYDTNQIGLSLRIGTSGKKVCAAPCSVTDSIAVRSSMNCCVSGQCGLSSMTSRPGSRCPNRRSTKARVWTMAASETSAWMRSSRAARSTPTAPPMLWPTYATRRSSSMASSTEPRSSTSLVTFESSKRPSESPLPEKAMRSEAIPRSCRRSESATDQGLTRSEVRP